MYPHSRKWKTISLCLPCPNHVTIKDIILPYRHILSGQLFERSCDHRANDNGVDSDVFKQTRNDDKPGHSIEANLFLTFMEDRLIRNDNSNWVAPLPFRDGYTSPVKMVKWLHYLPDNRPLAINRLKSLCKLLDKKPAIKQQCVECMAKLFSKRHAEYSKR